MKQPDPTISAPAWYLVYAKPRQERLALENLCRQGYTAYLPLIGNRRRGERAEPMFPRYLFVRLTAAVDNFAPIRSTFGVSRLVKFGDRYAILPDDFVTALTERADSDGVIESPAQELMSGERVVISAGALAGYEAIFSAGLGKQRIAVLLEIAGRTLRVDTAKDSVRRID